MATFRTTASMQCAFCPRTIPAATPYKYVFPIPAPTAHHIHEGAIACLDCWPTVHQAQLDQGLVVYALPEGHYGRA